MKTRIVHTKFWKDSFVSELNTEEKLVFLYYLTNENINILHLYECSDRQVVFDTGIDRGILDGIKQKFADANKILFFKDYVFLVNANRYEEYTGEKNEKAKKQLLNIINCDVVSWYEKVRKKIKDTPIDTPIMIGSINHKSETINHNSKVISQKPETRKEGMLQGFKNFTEKFSKDHGIE